MGNVSSRPLSPAELRLREETTIRLPSQSTGRSLCEAALAHMAHLEHIPQQAAAGLDEHKTAAQAARALATAPHEAVHVTHHGQHEPTRVVQMVLPTALRDRLLHELDERERIEAYIKSTTSTSVIGYEPFSLQFEASALFVPSCVEFMHLNRDIVRAHLPDVHSCSCNAFRVPPGGQPYGSHHAFSWGFHLPTLAKWRLFFPPEHKSFHTALTPTPLAGGQPLVMFDDFRPENYNIWHLAAELERMHAQRLDLARGRGNRTGRALLMQADEMPTAATMRLARVAFQAFHTGTPHVPNRLLRGLMDWMTNAFWASKACRERRVRGRQLRSQREGPTTQNSAFGGTGHFWSLQPGMALHFNNWRAHGDSGLHPSNRSRSTIDLRCFSKMSLPPGFNSSIEIAQSWQPQQWMLRNKGVECLLHLVGYDSQADFLSRVFRGVSESERPTSVVFAMGDLQYNQVNPGNQSLMHERQLEGMREHGLRVRALYRRLRGERAVRVRAFEKCIAEYKDVETRIHRNT